MAIIKRCKSCSKLPSYLGVYCVNCNVDEIEKAERCWINDKLVSLAGVPLCDRCSTIHKGGTLCTVCINSVKGKLEGKDLRNNIQELCDKCLTTLQVGDQICAECVAYKDKKYGKKSAYMVHADHLEELSLAYYAFENCSDSETIDSVLCLCNKLMRKHPNITFEVWQNLAARVQPDTHSETSETFIKVLNFTISTLCRCDLTDGTREGIAGYIKETECFKI